MADPIETAQKINELLTDRKKTLQEISNLESRSVVTARNLAAAVSKIADTKTINEGLERTNSLAEALGASAKKAGDEGGAAMDGMASKISQAVSQSNELHRSTTLLDKATSSFGLGMIAGLDGAVQGFKFSLHAAQNFFGVIATGIHTVAQLGMALVSLPFKILSHLMEQVTQGTKEFREELESIRKAFGDLARNESKAIIDGFRKVGGELSNTGLKVSRTMGFMHERLAHVHRMATELGTTFFRLKDELAGNAEEFFAYNKGLGLSEAAMLAVGQRALVMGTTFQEQGRRIASTAYQMGEAFGINGKLISRDIGEMMTDFKNFGNIAPEVLAGISVYAKRLGIDIKGLLGIIDKFDNFEDAAGSVAQLNQAFGINIDVLEQLKDQDPASRMERMRKAFFAAGKSIETMTRQERALLAQQTGLDDATLSLAFSQQSQAVSYEEIQKQSKATERQQLSQAEAMVKLANSIERLVRQGPELKGSFFQIFLAGFEKGTRYSHEFRKTMINLRGAMRQTFYTGMQVGREFMEFFPGVSEMFGGLAELFERGRWQKMLGRVRDAFREFFKAMSTDPKTALPKLMEKLKKNFFDFFNDSSGAGRKVLSGFKTFGKAIVGIFGQIVVFAAKGLTKTVKFIADFIKSPQEAIKALKQGAGAGGSFFGEIFSALAPAGAELWDSVGPQLLSAIKDLFGNLYDKIEPYAQKALPYLLAFMFGPAAIGAVVKGTLGFFAANLAGAIGRGIRRAFTSKTVERATDFGMESLSTTMTSPRNVRGVNQAIGGVGQTIGAASDAAGAAQKAQVSKGSVGKMLLIGTVITVGIGAIALGIAKLAEIIQEKKLQPGSMVAAAGIMLASGLVMAEVAGLMYILAAVGKIGPGMALPIVIGLGAVGLVSVGMAYAATHMIEAFQQYSASDINKATKVMFATSGIFLAAAAVTAVAGGVGAAILATAGVGGAAIAVGFDAIQGVLVKMTGTVMGIIETIRRVPHDGTFRKQQEVFTGILSAVGDMAGIISGIMTAATPSFSEIVFGGTSFTKKLSETQKFIDGMGTQLKDITDTFIQQATQFSGDDNSLAAAERMSTVIGNLLNAAKNLQLPPEMYDTGFFGTLMGDTASVRIQALGNYIESISSALSTTFKTVAGEFAQLTGGQEFSEGSARAATVISEILRSISSLASGMANVIRRQYGNDANDLAQVAPQLRNFIGAFVDGILGAPGERSIFSMSIDLVRQISRETAGMSADQANVVADAAKAIGSIFLSIGTLAELLAFQDTFKNLPEGRTISQELSAISEGFFGPLLKSVTGIIQVSVASFGNLNASAVKNLKAGFEALGSFFDVVKTIPEMFGSIREFGKGGADTANYADVAARLKTYQGFIYGDGNFNVVSFIDKLIPKLGVFDQMPRGLDGKVKSFSSALDALIKLPEAFSSVNSAVTQFERVAQGKNSDIATRVKSMVDSVNAITDSVKNVRIGNVDIALRKLASNMGLSATKRQEYTIQNRSFKIDLTVNVTLDANKFEEALTARPGGTRFAIGPSRTGD